MRRPGGVRNKSYRGDMAKGWGGYPDALQPSRPLPRVQRLGRAGQVGQLRLAHQGLALITKETVHGRPP